MLPSSLDRQEPTITLVFVTNADTDVAGEDYIRTYGDGPPQLDVWHGRRLSEVAIRTARQALLPGKHTLQDIGNVFTAPLVDAAQMALALIPATQLVRLPGIENLTLFDLNVRLGLGNTKINRELRQTIKTGSEHALFPAYHNGLTLLTDGLRVTDDGIELDGLAVVNGCQSLLALYRERSALSPDLKLVVKVVELGENAELADQITYRSNNQNPVNLRDQRSTDRIQRDLQEQVRQRYDGALFYEIRRGQPRDEAEGVLDNQLAAQILMAVWLGQPWNAIRKVRLFDQDYHRIFRRASADKLALAYLLDQAVQGGRDKLRPELQTAFASVRFAIAFLVGELLRQNDAGAQLLDTPELFLPDRRDEIVEELDRLAEFVVDEINYFVQSREESRRDDPEAAPFDPKTTFKSQAGVREVERQAVQAMKAIARRPDVPAYFHLSEDGQETSE
jgi:AIPR protein